jgi:hypothetical protein
MKNILILTSLLASSMSFAAVKINCKAANNTTSKTHKVTLTQVGDKKMTEQALRLRFRSLQPESRAIDTKEIVALSFEYVMVKANNRSKKSKFLSLWMSLMIHG